MQSRKTVKQAMKDLRPIGTGLSCFEIQDPFNEDEYHIFELAQNDKYIVVGSMCNVGMLPDWWIEIEDTFSIDQNLEAVYEILNEAIYNNELDDLNGLIEL